jgi:type I restriction enzyme, S subunit
MSLSMYPEYKDSGAPWIAEVPTHWCVKRLKFCLRLVTEKANERTNPVALENIESWSGRFIPTETEFSGEGVAFEVGDLLFGKLRPYLAKAYLAESCGEAVGDFHVLRPLDGLCPRFAQYLILSQGFISIVDGSTFGSKMPRVSWDFLGNTLLPFPKQREQVAIAAFLDKETGKIDALIAEQEKLLMLLAEKRQATISRAVTRGLIPNAPMKDSGVTWFGEVPAHWNIVRIKDVARLESGHTPSKQIPEYWENCDIPWVSLNDSKQLAVVDYISTTAVKINAAGLRNSSARMLPPNTVVFTRDATIGLAAITTIAMAVSQHLIAWCPSPRIDSLYLLRVFNFLKPHLDSLTFGATLKTIGMSDVKRLATPLPPVDEQREIIKFIASEARKIDALRNSSERAIALLKERRSALIAAAVTGKIDVRNLVKIAA